LGGGEETILSKKKKKGGGAGASAKSAFGAKASSAIEMFLRSSPQGEVEEERSRVGETYMKWVVNQEKGQRPRRENLILNRAPILEKHALSNNMRMRDTMVVQKCWG